MRGIIAAVTVSAVLLVSESCDLNPPGDKTPAGPPQPGVEVLIEVIAHPVGTQAKILINARDHSGRPSLSVLTGEFYPTEHVRRTPHREGIVHAADVTATYEVDAIMAGNPGDLLGCKIYVNGVVPDSPDATHVVEILEGMTSTQVWCTYTRYPVEA